MHIKDTKENFIKFFPVFWRAACLVFLIVFFTFNTAIFTSIQSLAKDESENIKDNSLQKQKLDIQGLLTEVKKYSKYSAESSIRVDDTVIKYIPKGRSKENVIKSLKDSKFGVDKIRNLKHFNPKDKVIWEEGYTAVLDITPFYLRLFLIKKEFKISLRFNKNILGAVGGEIKTTGL